MINRLKTTQRSLKSFFSRAASAGGFTLIETLASILILTIAITGPLTIAGKGLTVALVSKDQIVASYLAQDAAEYVRFLRDTSCLVSSSTCASNQWLSALSPCISANGTASCYLDSLSQNPAAPQSCGAADCSAFPLYFDSANNVYTYSALGTSKSIFTRTVMITTPVSSNADEALLTVTVSWRDVGNVVHSVTVQENMLNWE